MSSVLAENRIRKEKRTMKLMKIKDSYMFREKDPYKAKTKSKNAARWYFVYDKHKPVYVKGLTHLYYPDRKRFYQLKKGWLTKVKVNSFDVPSGMKAAEFRNAEGKPLSMKDIKDNTVQEKKRFSYKKVKPKMRQ